MKKKELKLTRIGLVAICLIIAGLLPSDQGWADGHHRANGWLERKASHRWALPGGGDKGNETTGQVAAWLLAAANLPVALSVLIRWINRFVPMAAGLKKALGRFNRFQKKHFMRFHYIGNSLVLGVALWHWLSSRCRSTALPEWGFAVMVGLVGLGLIMKFRLCPKKLRKSIYRLHTQPLVFVAMVIVLTIGHMLVD